MNRPGAFAVLLSLLLIGAFGWGVIASDAQMYFSYDKNGESRVTWIQEGDEIWIVIVDPDENTDCDVRDKIWTDVKLMDPKTGALLVWKSYEDPTGSPSGVVYGEDLYVPYRGHWPGATAGWLGEDYLEERGADTGVFVSKRAFQVGSREDYDETYKGTHVVGMEASPPTDFQWGGYLYLDTDQEHLSLKGAPAVRGDHQNWVGASGAVSPLAYAIGFVNVPFVAYEAPSDLEIIRAMSPDKWLIGRFENMDTLVGMYQDQNDPGDVVVAMMKITDVEATITWDRDIYDDANSAATITVEDADENLNCSEVEVVPVFILVNPGSWNPVGTLADESEQIEESPNNFCRLKRTGGIDGISGAVGGYRPIRWFNIYNAEKNDFGMSGAQDGRYYVQYPKLGVDDITIHKQLFDTRSTDGITAVSFYAQETGANTGIFQLNLNSLLTDLGFNSLNVRDVLVAYYLDPNDEDDFKLATATIEEHQHSETSFTDASRKDQEVYWIGRDPVYVQVIDANANVDPCCPEDVIVHLCDPHGEDDGEYWVLQETSSNSPTFFSMAGMELRGVWDALGVGEADLLGGYQLVLDNWKLEAFNEDDVYVRYNDVQYMQGDNGYAGLADQSTITAYSGPRIDWIRVANDVSFDLLSIADTQVYDGQTSNMWFLNRQGQRVTDYVNSDCLFVAVLDLDQDEDPYRRERIDAYWDGGQNYPFGPVPRNVFGCNFVREFRHPVNDLLGDTNIFNNSPDPYPTREDGAAKLYVLNPRNGRWAATDLMETAIASGEFVSVICIDLVDVYDCVPTLGALPGDTIIAVYQDPTNHSDSAWISIKVGIGGGIVPGQPSSILFTDAGGTEVASYMDTDLVYVQVTDPSHAGGALLSGALSVEGETFDLVAVEGAADTFMTAGLDLDLAPGDLLTAVYSDPRDPTDTSSDTIGIIASELVVERFYAAPSPFEIDCTFGFVGSGVAQTLRVEIYALSGELIWSREQTDATAIVWDGTRGAKCSPVANGVYLYTMVASDGSNTFASQGKVFVIR